MVKITCGVLLGVCACGAAAASNERLPASQQQIIIRAGSNAPMNGSTENFTGSVLVEPLIKPNADLNVSAAYVRFAAGVRSAWHTHPKGQYLLVTAGSGLTQEFGKPVQPIHVGDVVWCPPGVKHWHGASAAGPMTHMAITGVMDGRSVQWLEQVGDD